MQGHQGQTCAPVKEQSFDALLSSLSSIKLQLMLNLISNIGIPVPKLTVQLLEKTKNSKNLITSLKLLPVKINIFCSSD